MSDCIPDSTGKTCVNCGWQWKRDTPFPHRNCPKSPILKSAADTLGVTIDEYRTLVSQQLGTPEENLASAITSAEKLGITWSDARHYMVALASWGKAGFPTRPQEEVERIESTICQPCEYYVEGRCKKCGCRVTQGPALVNKIRMATESCPEKKW